ncbi:MAG TPA: vWA domain-containing protein, partial [Polyangiales bacterium]|nr:vWA domain-containing protein [Polyangiales bacterium]
RPDATPGSDAAIASGVDANMIDAGIGLAANPDSILMSSCATSTELSQLLPSNILFVIDRSGSMACNPPPTTTSSACESDQTRVDPKMPSKWELTSNALISAIQTLPDTDTIGISYFSNDDDCGVSSTPAIPLSRNTPAQQSAIASSLMSVMPHGATPLVGATILAYRHLHQAALAGEISGNQYVVLITDGQESDRCSDPQCSDADACTDLLVDTEVPKALADGVDIKTFVIGVPGSEGARSVLSRIAKNGGTALPNCDTTIGNCHFDMTKETDLGAAMQRALIQIAGQTLTCDLTLPKPDGGAIDLNLVNVVFTPNQKPRMVLPQDDHAPCNAGANGWQYNSAADQIQLCGDTCNAVRSDRGARIDIVLGCPVLGPV